MMRSVAAASAAVLLQALGSEACTIIAVGKDASATGAPMVGHTEDAGPMTNDVRLARVPRKKWPKGSNRPLFKVNAFYPRLVSADRSPEYAPVNGQAESVPLGYIPQVDETWAYWDTDYAVQNEWGLSIGESTCTANTVGWPADLPYGYNKVGIEELSKIAMERCKTARCAAQTMGDIAVEYGFYSADSGEPTKPGYAGSSECLTLADADGEIWNFNVMTGKNNASAIWAAQRMPSDHVLAVGNTFTIRNLDLADSENFLYSPNVTGLALEKGWWSTDLETLPGIFDFYYAYGYTPGADVKPPNMAQTLAYYSSRRMWRVFSLLSPAEGAKLDPSKGNLPHQKDPYPSSVPAPKGTVTLDMVTNAFRDHYEGTPYDLTVGMAAGPFGNPNRGPGAPGVVGQWERAISMYRTSWSFINMPRPKGRSLVWFGWDAPHGTAYLPFYGAATKGGPESYHSHEGHMAKFSTQAAWWPFNLVCQYQDLNFRLINADVRAKAAKVETTAQKLIAEWEHDADEFSMFAPEAAMDMLTARSNAYAEKVVADWWEFAFSLFAKYRGYVVTYNGSATGEDAHAQAYPSWWLESANVGFTLWSPEGPFHGEPDEAVRLGESTALVSNDFRAGIPVSVVAWGALFSVCAMAGTFQAGRRYGARTASSDVYVAYP